MPTVQLQIRMRWAAPAAVLALATCLAHATEAPVAGDSYVNSASPTTNYGSLTNLYVGAGGTAFIQFDLSSLPSGTTSSQISKATLRVFINRINTSGLVTVQPATGAWTEAGITYNTMPTLGSTVASFTPTVADEFITVDVTSVVQGWVTNPATNYGLALASAAGNVVLDSKEATETSHAAELDITVVNQGPTGATGAQGPQGIQGPIGPTGLQGAQGIQGIPGPVGPIGPVGAQGPAGPTGAQGPVGATGAQGPAGPTGAQGPPVNFRNTWLSTTSYNIGDAVSLNGTSYIALQANSGINPATDVAGSGGHWAVLALAGATGATGPQGAQGPQGPQGPEGPTGPQGATGPAGPAGSGLTVTDANGNALGTLVGSGYGPSITLYKNGYFISVNIDGTFTPSQIWWSDGGSCGGTGYLNDGEEGAGGIPTYAKTVVWSSATNSWYVTSGTATKGVVMSVSGAGTTSAQISDPPYAPQTTYFSPDFSIENSGNADGSWSCSIHQAYYDTGSSYELITASNPEPGGYGLGYSGWVLSSFDPQTALGWPAFSSCSTTEYGEYNGENGDTGTNSTQTVDCLAGPLVLP